MSLPEIPNVFFSLQIRRLGCYRSLPMSALLIPLLATLRATHRSRLELEAEIFAVRHQLAVLRRPGLRGRIRSWNG
ncbi:MAG: hypothetical protein IMZ46_12045 [Acidobacteria bacterium]|nr:hypothetical protein [Acidobacteriota bacterium]